MIKEELSQPDSDGRWLLNPVNSYSREVTVKFSNGHYFFKGDDHGARWFRCSAQPGTWERLRDA